MGLKRLIRGFRFKISQKMKIKKNAKLQPIMRVKPVLVIQHIRKNL